jgi:RimK family alpha-L-glutamate ligase
MGDIRGSEPTVGVLGVHVSKETKAILNAVEALGYETAWLRRENASVAVRDGEIHVEPDIDIVVNRLLLSSSRYPTDGIGLARTLASVRPMLNRPEAVATAVHKFSTAVALAEAGVPVPDSVLALSNARLKEAREQFGERAVYKTAIGTHGGGAWVVNGSPLEPRVRDRQAFLQEFVDTGEVASDLRVYLVGDEIIGAMYRNAPEGEWRSNVALGADVADATEDIPDQAAESARNARAAIGLDYAGVDLISDGEQWYVLEVNSTAGFRGLFQATGVSPAPAIAAMALERVGESVDDAEVAELAETLDDSKPSCTPPKPPRDEQKPTIGFIETARVIGTEDSEVVEAKSDTGARRTSVDLELAARLGTGSIKDTVTVRSGTSKQSNPRPIVDLTVAIDGRTHTVEANVQDRLHMNYQLLLGRDILEAYQVDVSSDATDERSTKTSEE